MQWCPACSTTIILPQTVLLNASSSCSIPCSFSYMCKSQELISTRRFMCTPTPHFLLLASELNWKGSELFNLGSELFQWGKVLSPKPADLSGKKDKQLPQRVSDFHTHTQTICHKKKNIHVTSELFWHKPQTTIAIIHISVTYNCLQFQDLLILYLYHCNYLSFYQQKFVLSIWL